jgi:hypothetical protein
MTTSTSRYIIDSNVFMTAHRDYYAPDVCPGFWDCLLYHHTSSRVCTIDRIKKELINKTDWLADWAKNKAPAALFHNSGTADVVHWYTEMVGWVQAQSQYFTSAKYEFANKADSWLIAYAKANDMILVTHEVLSPGINRKVPIPNVCKPFDVQYVNTFAMLRDLSVSFGWKP